MGKQKIWTVILFIIFGTMIPKFVYASSIPSFTLPSILFQNSNQPESSLTSFEEENFDDFDLEDESNNKKEILPEDLPLSFFVGFRFNIIWEQMRGAAFNFLDNNFGYDQVIPAGSGLEVEFSVSLTRYWVFYVSGDRINFSSRSGKVSQKITNPPTPATLTPIQFHGWKHISFMTGFKLFPFEEETGFLPFFKFGAGVVLQTEVTSTFKGNQQIQIPKHTAFAGEIGFGLEYRIALGSFKMGLTVEAMVRLIKQKGLFIQGKNNAFALPVKFGISIYF